MMPHWIDELDALRAKDNEVRLSDAEYARWEELVELISEGFAEEAKLYDRRGEE